MDYHLESGSEIIPIHIDDDFSSLSAIMLGINSLKGSLQGGRVKAGTRSIHAFGGRRVKGRIQDV